MHPVLVKTFGGLSRQYYFRQFVFGLLFFVFMYSMSSQNGHSAPLGFLAMMVINTLLYPYSRFVYEGITGFIMGNNLFIVNALVLLFVKIVTMAVCWSLAVLIAPIGLAYLYLRNSRAGA